MNCEEFETIYFDFASGQLSPAQEQHVVEHRALCPGCQSWVQSAAGLASAWQDADESAEVDKVRAVMMRIDCELGWPTEVQSPVPPFVCKPRRSRLISLMHYSIAVSILVVVLNSGLFAKLGSQRVAIDHITRSPWAMWIQHALYGIVS